MPTAAICTYCGEAFAVENTNDWIEARQITRLDNPTTRVDADNKPIAGDFHSLDCLIGWAKDRQKDRPKDVPIAKGKAVKT